MRLIRHGKTKMNEEGRYSGAKTDEDLSIKGIKELRHFNPSSLTFISPLKRCRQTLEIITDGKYDNLIIVDEFKEMDFGIFEGHNYEELNGNEDYQAYIDSNGESPFPGGESKTDFIKRVKSGLDKSLEIILRENVNDVMYVVHGGTIMAVMSILTGGEYFDFMVSNGNGYNCTIEIEDDGSVTKVSYDKFFDRDFT